MSEIANKLNVSDHKVYWWMTKYGIPRRNRSEATYIKRNPNGDPFHIKTNLNHKEKILYGLGLGVYWGEGTKANREAVRVGNSDPNLIKIFIEFLTRICRVKKEKIKFGIQIFKDINQEKAVRYWEKTLGFSRKHFFPKVIVSPGQGKGTYKNKSRYGVVTLVVCNIKLRNWLIGQLDQLKPR